MRQRNQEGCGTLRQKNSSDSSVASRNSAKWFTEKAEENENNSEY